MVWDINIKTKRADAPPQLGLPPPAQPEASLTALTIPAGNSDSNCFDNGLVDMFVADLLEIATLVSFSSDANGQNICKNPFLSSGNLKTKSHISTKISKSFLFPFLYLLLTVEYERK